MGMEEHGSKATNVGVSIILTLAIIAAVVTIVTIALKMTTTGATEATNLSGQMEESKYSRYDNTQVTGDQIVSLIKQFENDQVGIRVENGSNHMDYIYELTAADYDNRTGALADKPRIKTDATGYNQALLDMTDKSKPSYISPGKKYLCHVLKNTDTEAIVGLYFKVP